MYRTSVALGANIARMSAGVAALKEQANALFKAAKYDDAIAIYSQAIQSDSSNALLFSNRSAAYLKVHKAQEALEDAQQVVKLQPKWDKGHFRTGAAYEQLGKPEQALIAYQAALDLTPVNQEIIAKVRELKNQLKETHKKQQEEASRQSAARNRSGPSHPRAVQASNIREPSPSGWASGLTAADQAEWFIDCYRMRVDDDMCWGGGNLHGLYDTDSTTETIAEDFLIFCKLAVKAKIVPAGFNWAACLKKAVELLPYAFEKSDAKERWGGENVFSAIMGGRSLRFTAEVVYGFSCMGATNWRGKETAAFREMSKPIQGAWQGLISDEKKAMFDDVGGAAAWREMQRALRIPRANW